MSCELKKSMLLCILEGAFVEDAADLPGEVKLFDEAGDEIKSCDTALA